MFQFSTLLGVTKPTLQSRKHTDDTNKFYLNQQVYIMDLIFFKILVTRNIPTIHSSIWYSPRPGHSPRFDPKKLRESMKLNLSTEVFFTLTSSLNRKLNTKCPSHLLVVPSSTVATVLKQGRRQSETFDPMNMSAKEICK